MDPNGAPLPQVPEVPIAPIEAAIIPPVPEATPQLTEQLPVAAPVITEPVLDIYHDAQPEVIAPTNSPSEAIPSIPEAMPSRVSSGVLPQNSSPESPAEAPQAREELETSDVPLVKDVQGLEQYRKPDELGQALEATLGSEVG